VRVVGGVVIIVMGLALLGVARTVFGRERRLIPQLPAIGGVARPYVVGVAFGAGWSPCVGPLLAAALTIAARSQEVGRGTILLCAYAMASFYKEPASLQHVCEVHSQAFDADGRPQHDPDAPGALSPKYARRLAREIQ